jgi:transposase
MADELCVGFSDVKEMSEDDVYRLFFPDKHAPAAVFEEPDYAHVHEQLKRTGVTLKLLWREYQDDCSSKGAVAMGYSRFCKGYGGHMVANRLTSHLDHKPGQCVEADWSGPTMSFLAEATGESVTVHLFDAFLPYSQYAYVVPTLDMRQDTWLRCHVNMYSFFDGSPVRTVCENLKTGVISHPREGDIVLNDAYVGISRGFFPW